MMLLIHRNRFLSAIVAITILLSTVIVVAALFVRASSETNVDATTYYYYYSTCNKDSDCTPKVRSRYPSQSSAGVQLCKCYAASSITPFDECEGESDTTCMMAKCANSCTGQVAYCRSSSTCSLRKGEDDIIGTSEEW